MGLMGSRVGSEHFRMIEGMCQIDEPSFDIAPWFWLSVPAAGTKECGKKGLS
jgi:hypothetical protein